MVKTATIELSTRGHCDIVNITPEVEEQVKDSGLADGIITVFIPGSTGAITTIEHETGLIKDLGEFFQKILPEDVEYHHDKRWGDGNGFSHLRAALLGPSLTIPFNKGKLELGTWQQVVFLDFDNRPRSRKIVCQLIGE